MAKDYVRKRQAKQRSNAPRQLLLLLASFLGGYLTATIFDFTSLSAWVNKHVLAAQELHPEATVPAKKAEAPKPKFEFYTLLAKDSSPQVLANRPGSASPRALPPANTATAHTAQQATQVTRPTAAPVNAKTQAPALPQAVTVAESKPAANPAPAKNSKEYYLVQIASFNRRQDAEQVKANLVLKGFDVIVTSVPQGQMIWFRVLLGPYHSRLQAEKAQAEIARSEHMKGMIRKMDA
ncbi:Sporulation domain-containing protein [Legionella birminghamensis]|uniref:Sporulation domain-containing protein n=1 Tax=Legionella birminghamensis TaxID=28083 RepID=A0A378IBC3_9GAMM|nr:SPOR domain-containing protein [Legionella birminghamensis]KTC71635.1 Sporulation domain-containing protein [Legionella birminghamensis]STX32528.1 Sporulation domain-containing protein [Legionella birminghamensis]